MRTPGQRYRSSPERSKELTAARELDRGQRHLGREDCFSGPPETVADPRNRHPPSVSLVPDETRAQRRQKRVGHERSVQIGASLLDEHLDVAPIERIDGTPVPSTWITRLRDHMELNVTVDQFQERIQEGDQPLCRLRPRTQWRRTEQDP
jgi:hypothetical protein